MTTFCLSKSQQDRPFYERVTAPASQRVSLSLNGVLAKGETLDSVRFQTTDGSPVVMSDPVIESGGRVVSLRVNARYSGRCRIRVSATDTNGNVFSTWMVFDTICAPQFTGDNTSPGPSELVVEA